jgi:hypothetical protein
MRPLFCAVLAGVLLAGVTIAAGDAEAGGRKRWKHHRGSDHYGAYYDGHDRGGYYEYDRGYFSRREIHLVREYYRPRYRALPAGLRRQYYRRGYLPPGWQRRIQPYPVYVEREVVVVPHGYHRGIIDGHAVIYNGRGLILDVAVLF